MGYVSFGWVAKLFERSVIGFILLVLGASQRIGLCQQAASGHSPLQVSMLHAPCLLRHLAIECSCACHVGVVQVPEVIGDAALVAVLRIGSSEADNDGSAQLGSGGAEKRHTGLMTVTLIGRSALVRICQGG